MEILAKAPGFQEREESSTELVAPYPYAIGNYAKEKIKGHDDTIDKIFGEISMQAIASFNPSVESQEFPGVKISTIELEFTQDFARSLNKNQTSQSEPQLSEDKDAKERELKTYVIFFQPAFGAGRVGNAFSILDAASDRLIRGLPKVLEGDRVVAVLQGSPLSLPGAVTPEWVKGVVKTGFDMHGRLYAEHAKKYLHDEFGDDLENVVVTLQGQSMGSNTAARTVEYLNENKPGNMPDARGLYDTPTGNHDRKFPDQFRHSINMVSGLVAETIARDKMDQVQKDLQKTEGPFWRKISKLKGIKPDSFEQTLLKTRGLLAEVISLGRGTPIDEKDRGYYREPGFDPTNIPKDILKNLYTEGIGLRLKPRRPFLRLQGRNLIARTTIDGHYFFPWQNDLHRWEQIFQKTEGGNNPIVHNKTEALKF